jgi:hypothetical protein
LVVVWMFDVLRGRRLVGGCPPGRVACLNLLLMCPHGAAQPTRVGGWWPRVGGERLGAKATKTQLRCNTPQLVQTVPRLAMQHHHHHRHRRQSRSSLRALTALGAALIGLMLLGSAPAADAYDVHKLPNGDKVKLRNRALLDVVAAAVGCRCSCDCDRLGLLLAPAVKCGWRLVVAWRCRRRRSTQLLLLR